MERFVFVAAIVVASFYAIGVLFGGFHSSGNGWRFHFDGGPPAELVALAPGEMAAQSFTSGEIRVRHTAARIVVIAEDRADISVEISNPGAAPMPTVERGEEGGVLVDGLLRGRIDGCDGETVRLTGYEDISREQMPLITIRAPRDVEMQIGGASFTEIGAAQSVNVSHLGCGTTVVADVTGDLEINLAGSGEVRAGAAASLNANVAGSGQVTTGAIAGDAEINVAGSGDLDIAAVNGVFNRDGSGSGDVIVRGGAITNADIRQAGSGDVEITAPVQALDVAIMGSGGVLVTGDVGSVDARIMGSGSVTVRGTAGTIDANIMGSGEVRATAISGEISQRQRGSGRVVIGP